MRILIIAIFLTACLASSSDAHCQKRSDTTAIIHEFNKVMAFAVQPYLSYTSIMTLRSGPLAAADTGRVLHNQFYKLQDDLYYGNEEEEVFLQDTLLVQVNHHRKSINLGLVDAAFRKKMDVLPLQKMDMQRLLRSHYTIMQEPDEGDTACITMRSEDPTGLQRVAGSEIRIRYIRQTHLPVLMAVMLRMRQPVSSQGVDMLKQKGFDVAKMVEDQGGKQSLITTENLSVRFGAIADTREDAMKMPSWKDRIAYDPVKQHFSGKGGWEDYEVVKTF
jgi:hypothetical protein